MKKKHELFTFILNDKYYIGSFITLFFLSYSLFNFSHIEFIINVVKIFLFSLFYCIFTIWQCLLIPIIIIIILKYYNINYKDHLLKFNITRFFLIILSRWFLFIYLGLPYITHLLFIEFDLLYIISIFFIGIDQLDFVLRYYFPNTHCKLNNNFIKPGPFSQICSPIDEYESYIPNNNSNSLDSPGVYLNDRSPSSHLSPVVNLRRYSLSSPISPSFSPLPISSQGSPTRVLSSTSPVPENSNIPLIDSPLLIPSISSSPRLSSLSSIRSISPFFSENRSGEIISEYNPYYNTIVNNEIAIGPDVNISKLICYNYIDSSSGSIVYIKDVLLNSDNFWAIEIKEINRYYDPIKCAWWNNDLKKWVDSRIEYNNNDFSELIYPDGKFHKKNFPSYTSFFINKMVKKSGFSEHEVGELNKLNSWTMNVINLFDQINNELKNPDYIQNSSLKDTFYNYLKKNEDLMKGRFLRLFKWENEDRKYEVVVKHLQEKYIRNNRVDENTKHYIHNLIMQLLAQRTQNRVMLNDIAYRHYEVSRGKEFEWVKPSDFQMYENYRNIQPSTNYNKS